jgi:hypothetical protein
VRVETALLVDGDPGPSGCCPRRAGEPAQRFHVALYCDPQNAAAEAAGGAQPQLEGPATYRCSLQSRKKLQQLRFSDFAKEREGYVPPFLRRPSHGIRPGATRVRHRVDRICKMCDRVGGRTQANKKTHLAIVLVLQ